MKGIDFINTLEEQGMLVFTFNDAVKILKKRNYARVYLQMLVKNKLINMLERGKYSLKDVSVEYAACGMVTPSYISMLYALNHHKLITQMPSTIDVISPRRHKKLNLYGFTLLFRYIKPSRFFGFKKSDTNVFFADAEKAILDLLYFNYPNLYLINETFANAYNSKLIDIKKLKEYAKRMRSKTLINKIGFIMEKNEINADDLLKFKLNKYITLQNGRNKDKKWGVIYAKI